MDADMRLKVLEKTYIHILVDSIINYSKYGVLDQVTKGKKGIQMRLGKMQAEQFGMTKPEDVFNTLSAFFNCAKWEIKHNWDGIEAVAKGCQLCAHAKDMSSDSPCHLYCLNPMEGMVKGLKPEAEFKVEETLWDGKCCRVKVTW